MSGMKLIMEGWRAYINESADSINSPLSPEQNRILHLLSSYEKEEVQEDLSVLMEQELNEGALEDVKKWFLSKLKAGSTEEELKDEFIDDEPDMSRRDFLENALTAAALLAFPSTMAAGTYKMAHTPTDRWAPPERPPPERKPPLSPTYKPDPGTIARRAQSQGAYDAQNRPGAPEYFMPVDEFQWSPSPAAGLLWVTPAQIPDDYILLTGLGAGTSAAQYKNKLITRKTKGSEKDYYDISSLEKNLFGNQGIWAYTRRKGMQAFDIHPDFKAPMLPLIWSKMFEVYTEKVKEQIDQVRALSQADLQELARKTGVSVEDLIRYTDEIEMETVGRLKY
jgi:hypothetical protein